ncbi:hypothetical protein Hokovirus_1_3 [Hokovirus HKV1]|uniref:Uncharacterized protein n=1 Tax=Hokovirus HKV1 TaxID=1977638 RepID=A0A1V0SER6_9VIRU|nr:hypothetical protein Hokovirus_1_3 [Hokovirus HKV1]
MANIILSNARQKYFDNLDRLEDRSICIKKLEQKIINLQKEKTEIYKTVNELIINYKKKIIQDKITIYKNYLNNKDTTYYESYFYDSHEFKKYVNKLSQKLKKSELILKNDEFYIKDYTLDKYENYSFDNIYCDKKDKYELEKYYNKNSCHEKNKSGDTYNTTKKDPGIFWCFFVICDIILTLPSTYKFINSSPEFVPFLLAVIYFTIEILLVLIIIIIILKVFFEFIDSKIYYFMNKHKITKYVKIIKYKNICRLITLENKIKKLENEIKELEN